MPPDKCSSFVLKLPLSSRVPIRATTDSLWCRRGQIIGLPSGKKIRYGDQQLRNRETRSRGPDLITGSVSAHLSLGLTLCRLPMSRNKAVLFMRSWISSSSGKRLTCLFEKSNFRPYSTSKTFPEDSTNSVLMSSLFPSSPARLTALGSSPQVKQYVILNASDIWSTSLWP